LTGIIVTIPLNYHGKVHRLGKCCSSVEDIKHEKASCFSVEQQFEIPIGPWGKGLVQRGSIIEVIDIDHDRDLVMSVRHIEDSTVVIREGIPLHFPHDPINISNCCSTLKQLAFSCLISSTELQHFPSQCTFP
jgi:hypothetical protein